MERVLHIGAGKQLDGRYKDSPMAQYITNDISNLEGISWVYDLDMMPWPFPDSYFDRILAIDILEHLEDTKSAIEECWRLLKPCGILEIQVPFFGSYAHATDITHKRGFTPNSFGFFIPNHIYCQSQPWYTEARFKCKKFALDGTMHEFPTVPQDWMHRMLYHSTVGNIQIDLEKV